MFYTGDDPCPLPHDPLKAIITPRPIGWITTIGSNGVVNLAPYSYFNAVNSKPGVLMFSSEGYKDTAKNAVESGEFVFSLATVELQNEMNLTSEAVDDSIDEYEHSGLEKADSTIVKPPRVAASPVSLECKTIQSQSLTGLNNEPMDVHIVFGQIVGTYIHDDYITADGRFDTAKANPLARCGYRDFAEIGSLFELKRPDD